MKKILSVDGTIGHDPVTLLLRLLGALALYLCFGLMAELVYATDENTDPLESTQGSVWLLPETGSYTNALLLQTEVAIDVSGMIARAIVKQRFKNTSDFWAEGLYVFPLPANAAVDHFNLRIGERLIEGQIQEREQARMTYESAKQEGRQAGLIEQQRANVFTTSIANIAPGESISVTIEYQQTLEYDSGRYRLRFPMVVGPRFQASNQLLQEHDGDSDVSTIVSTTPVNPVSINVTLDAGVPVAELESSYHTIAVRQISAHRYSIELADGGIFADRDFELVWRPELSEKPHTVVFSEQHDEHEYLLLSVLPPDLEALGQQLLPRDVIFVLDVSGSMAGTSIEQARAALIEALSRLKAEDRFNLIWFNDRTERLYPRAMPATAEQIQYASTVIDRLDADGGTVMLPALALALNVQPELNRVRQVVFLTDGNVDNEKDLFAVIKERLGDNRLFTIGIGSAPNSVFMRKAARAGRGSFTYIGDIDEVQQKTHALLQKLESPALINIEMQIQGEDVEAFPEPLPDLYLGEPVTVLLRGKQLADSITLYGDYGESTWQQSVGLTDSADHAGIHIAWARSKIASLLEKYRSADTEHDRDTLKHQIVHTSIDHHLLSRFTSLVAVDVTPVNSTGLITREKLKTNLPHGWKHGQDQQPASQQIRLAQLRLPQTATSAWLHMMIASMLFALAMVFYQWRKVL
ncbi:MAG: marine proteobacterial sortase target protein [Gammaproteobacteria bacterium]